MVKYDVNVIIKGNNDEDDDAFCLVNEYFDSLGDDSLGDVSIFDWLDQVCKDAVRAKYHELIDE